MNYSKNKTLLLNSTYEPIKVIGVKKAMTLKFRDKVYIEETHKDIFIYSAKDKWEVPSVIRLKEYTNIIKNKQTSAIKRNKIYTRDKRKCGYCLKNCNNDIITIDHITPKSQGGGNSPQNLVTCCIKCNQTKGNRTPEEANMPLKYSITKLKVGLDRHEMVHYAEESTAWKKYLFLGSDK